MLIHTASLLFSGLASLLLGVLVLWQGRAQGVHRFLALNSLAVSVWCLAQAMGDIAPGKEAVILWTRINIGAAILIPAFFLAFVLAFLDLLDKKKSVLSVTLAGTAGIAAGPLLIDDFA